MILKDLVLHLDKLFNKNLAASWDKTGLQVGDLNNNIKQILITLDITGMVIEEAKSTDSNLILSHHPLIFNPITTLVNENIIGQKILNILENKIAVYINHTNYDLMFDGLNDYYTKKLDLTNVSIIESKYEQWYKFVIFVPVEAENKVRDAICRNGGGMWRNYSCCTFNIAGTGTFKPLEGSNPYTGEVGSINSVNEIRIECIVCESDLNNVIGAALTSHPYEEPAYDIYKIDNKFETAGIGRIGELKTPKKLFDLFEDIKVKMEVKNFRWAAKQNENFNEKIIRKIAVINGSANSLTQRVSVYSFDCDLVIVGELNYHNTLEIIESGKIIVELGHCESEKYAIDDMYSKLKNYFEYKNLEKIKIIKSRVGYEPWRYYIE